MSMRAEEIEALAADYQYLYGKRIVVTVGFTASFYFWGGHTPQKRAALADCMEAFEKLYGQHLSWGCEPESWVTLKIKKMPRFQDYMKTLDEDDAVAWYAASGTDDEAANEYSISILTERGWMNGEMSSLRFQLPRKLVFDPAHQQEISTLLHFCQARLDTFHGRAGFGVVLPEQLTEWEPEELDVATRYFTLYAGDDTDQTQAPNGIKSVDYLTFIGDVLCERIGGRIAFEAYCRRHGVAPMRNGNGYIIRAGDLPELAPVADRLPETYVRFNAALRPLRNGNYGSMGSGSIKGELRFDRCTSDLWIRRFDAPNIWPPASFIGLGRSAPGVKPARKLELKSGDTCTRYGRYRDPDDDADDEDARCVVLQEGDLAPYRLKLGPHGEFLGRESVAWELHGEL